MTITRSKISGLFVATIIIDDQNYIHVNDINRQVAMKKCSKLFNEYLTGLKTNAK